MNACVCVSSCCSPPSVQDEAPSTVPGSDVRLQSHLRAAAKPSAEEVRTAREASPSPEFGFPGCLRENSVSPKSSPPTHSSWLHSIPSPAPPCLASPQSMSSEDRSSDRKTCHAVLGLGGG